MHASASFAWLLSLGMLGTAIGKIDGPMWTYDTSKFPSEKLKKAIRPKGKHCNLVIQPSSLEGSTKVRRALLVNPYIQKASTPHDRTTNRDLKRFKSAIMRFPSAVQMSKDPLRK